MIMDQLPIKNCTLFLSPSDAASWRSVDTGGVVGVFVEDVNGQYTILDVFESDVIPSYDQLVAHERFMIWEAMAGGKHMLRFDMYPMPLASPSRRQEVVALIQRSCGVATYSMEANFRKAA